MVQANELRIGNWLEFYNLIDPVKNVKVTARFFASLAGGRPINEIKDDEELSNYYRPIKLTSEILEKCGFERKTTGIHAILTPDLNYKFTVGYVGEGHYFSSNATANKPISFLHELQNLYFALTGEELNIQL